MVFGHAWRGFEQAGLLPADDLFRAVDSAIYAFHMPLFFFLSGWFFPATLRRFEAAELGQRVLWRLFYPMCLWTYVFIAMKLFAGDSANDAVSLRDLLIWPVPGQLHLWFLWAMILIQSVVIVLRPVALRAMVPFFATATVLSVLLWVSSLVPASEWTIGAIGSAPFFFLGGLWQLIGKDFPTSRAAAVLALAAFVAAEAVAILYQGHGIVLSLLVGVVAVVALLVLVRVIDENAADTPGWFTRLLVTLGQYSMTIYVTHTIFSAATRIFLSKVMDVNAVLPSLLLVVLAGLFLPLLLHLRRMPALVNRVLGLPGENRLVLFSERHKDSEATGPRP